MVASCRLMLTVRLTISQKMFMSSPAYHSDGIRPEMNISQTWAFSNGAVVDHTDQ